MLIKRLYLFANEKRDFGKIVAHKRQTLLLQSLALLVLAINEFCITLRRWCSNDDWKTIEREDLRI